MGGRRPRSAPWSPRPAPAPRRPRKKRLTPWAVARHAMLVGICLLAIYPLLFVLLTALKTQADYSEDPLGLPWPITFSNFGEALRGGEFFTWFKNSVILTLGSRGGRHGLGRALPRSRSRRCAGAGRTCCSRSTSR